MTNLQTPEYKELRDLILQSEGKTIEDELGFGCYAKMPYYKDKVVIISSDEEETKLFPLFCIKTETAKHPQGRYGKPHFEILGRPISLDRVLMALGPNFVCKVTDGNYGHIFSLGQATVDWYLGKSAHEQPLETIKKLLNILKT